MSHNELLLKMGRVNNAKLRLICFPYAGGNSSMFKSWVNELPDNVDVLAVELPGRLLRFNQPAYRNMERLIEDLVKAFQNLSKKPYVLVGHSLGSLIAFELMCSFRRQGIRGPEHFIVSGCSAPHIKEEQKNLHQLPDEEFTEELRKLNGTPEEILDNSELMALSLPSIRADFELSETYSYAGSGQIDCPLTILRGDRDIDISHEDAQAWQDHFIRAAELHVVPGDHFFIDTNRDAVLAKIRSVISDTLRGLEKNHV